MVTVSGSSYCSLEMFPCGSMSLSTFLIMVHVVPLVILKINLLSNSASSEATMPAR